MTRTLIQIQRHQREILDMQFQIAALQEALAARVAFHRSVRHELHVQGQRIDMLMTALALPKEQL